MFTVGDVNENKVLRLHIEGKLTMKEYTHGISQCEALLSQHGKLRFYMELLDFTGCDPNAAWEGMKFDISHRNQYDRSAIVGDKVWEEWMTKISGIFFHAPVQFFYKQDAEKAWEWVNSHDA